ncbi:MAG: NAD-dependent succinate-semialdehyde dehydrogenase [Bacteroidales bacterium]
MTNYLTSINPYNNELIERYRELGDKEVDERVRASAVAFESFRETSFGYRSSRMKEAAAVLRRNRTAYARIITLEMGKLLRESEAEVEKCAWVCEFYATEAEGFLAEREIATGAKRSSVIYQPLGPVLAVMPWNFPFWQVFRFAAPALMAGNTALLKHASNVQGCAGAIAEVFREAGFGADVFQNLSIKAPKVERVIASQEVKAVTLTGSESAGSAVAASAGKHLKKSVLELGGNNAFVVLKDADLALAVDVAMKARLQNSGQSCIAAKRFIIEEEVHDRFVDMLLEQVQKLEMGDPFDPETGIAPLFSKVQADEVERQVTRSVNEGAVILAGGKKYDAFYEPAVITEVKPGMAVFDEETFGPVFAVSRAADPDAALALSNRSDFGLGMQVFTRNDEMVEKFIRGAVEGAVFINEMVKSDPRVPFGGVKKSGFGRELSGEGIREFVNTKTIWRN